MPVNARRVPARVGNRARPRSAYSDKVRTLVWPAPTRIALSLVIATTRKSPSLSPMKSVLPLIMADGRLGLKTIACKRSGAGLGGGGGARTGALVALLSSALGSGLLAGAFVTSATMIAAVLLVGAEAEAGFCAGAG